VLYALGGAGGGLACNIDDSFLCYEYNTFIVMRTTIRSESKLPEGHAKILVSVPVAFTANDCLDIGTCLGRPCRWPTTTGCPSPVNDTIRNVNVRYTS
jgi:hypothetical protein